MKFLAMLALVAATAPAQTNLLTVTPPPKLHARRGETVTAKIRAQLKPGYHSNSNTPSDDYLIPFKLTWKADPLEVRKVIYPKAQTEKYAFSEKPLSVFSGDLDIATEFAVPAKAPPGRAEVLSGCRAQRRRQGR